MSNLHDENVILVGRLEALSADHERVCEENNDLKNQIVALKEGAVTKVSACPEVVFTKQELIDLIMRQAIAWAKKFNIKVDSYKTEGTKTTLVLDTEETN